MIEKLTKVSVVITVLVIAGAISGCGKSTQNKSKEKAFNPAKAQISVISSSVRVTPKQDISTLNTSKSINLDTARGESEAAQLIVDVKEGNPSLTITSSKLTSRDGKSISSSAVKAYFLQLMRVEHGSPASRSGSNYDPLVPSSNRAISFNSGQRFVVWVDINTPTGVAPGVYEGKIELRHSSKEGIAYKGEDALIKSIPISVNVHKTVLPKKPILGSSIGVDASQIIRFEGVEPGSKELFNTIDNYAKVLAQARLSIADVGVFVPGALAGENKQIDSDKFLRTIFNRRGVSSVRIPFYMDSPFADPLGRDRPAAVAYLRAAAKWAKKEGWIDRAYVYAIDEPDISRVGEVRELHELLREADPALKLLVTREFSAREFRGYVDIWVPNISPRYFHIQDVLAASKQGNKTWWYPSITTWQPYPDLFIDETRPAPRALGWLAWRYGIKGFLYWSATHWHEIKDPYRDSATYQEPNAVGNGDGVLLYPGKPIGNKGVPSPSIRLLQLRDGIDDYDLFTMASQKASLQERAKLNKKIFALAPSMKEFSPSDKEIKDARLLALSIIDNAS